MTIVASLGEAESRRQQKAVCTVSQSPSVPQLNSIPVQVIRTQDVVRFLGAGVDHTKINSKLNMYLLELWKQL